MSAQSETQTGRRREDSVGRTRKEKDNIQVPTGTAMLMSVSTSTFPFAGTTLFLEAYKS